MNLLRIVLLLLAGDLCLRANPFVEAETDFLRELNSMEGIELTGGPFHSGERHHFEGESGYFVIAPAMVLPTLDQRLSIQTKWVQPKTEAAPDQPEAVITTPDYDRDSRLGLEDRREIHRTLARGGFAERQDEITLFENGSVRSRPVLHLRLLKLIATNVNSCVALLGAQTWQGVPLYRATFDRTRGNFDLETFRESFVPKRLIELPLRPAPLYSPQTFVAERGLAVGDWTRILRNFSRLDLPSLRILDASLTEQLVTLRADTRSSMLPQFWVKLQKRGSGWEVVQAVEFRAEFPRPGPWWTFLPLLPRKAFADHPSFGAKGKNAATTADRIAVGSIVQRLRGVGEITRFVALSNGVDRTIRVRTVHDGWRGYHLDFARLKDHWRLTTVSEWAE